MMQEIEYKYLVDKVLWDKISKPAPDRIVQAFISKTKECIVRVRIKGDKGFITIKGETKGITRTEFEYEIPFQEAEELIEKFTDKCILKDRFEIIINDHVWEVDVFHGPLEGLILAELEVESEDEKFDLPPWVTEDVSTDQRYYNAVLIDKC
jgi:adenylate cyclase